jgi:ferredoxin
MPMSAAHAVRMLLLLLWNGAVLCSFLQVGCHRPVCSSLQVGCHRPLGAVHGQQRCCHQDACLRAVLTMGPTKEEEDKASNERLMAALFEREEEAVKSKDIPSHQQLDVDENGEPLLLRFAYVDEPSCIGCTYCAEVARNTFYMNEDAGRARVFAQGVDSPEVVIEAIECCPYAYACATERRWPPSSWPLAHCEASRSRVRLPPSIEQRQLHQLCRPRGPGDPRDGT